MYQDFEPILLRSINFYKNNLLNIKQEYLTNLVEGKLRTLFPSWV